MSTSEKVKEVAEKAKVAVDHAADRAHESAEHFRERTHDTREHAKEKTKEEAHRARDFVRRVPPWAWIVLGLLLAGIIGYLLGHAGSKPSHPKKAQTAPPAPQGPPTLTLDPQQLQYAEIRLSPAQQVTLPNRLATTGIVAANLNGQADVMPPLPGRIVRVLANVGQRVRAGQTVAVLTSPDLAAAQASYRAALVREAAAGAALTRLQGLASLGQFSRPPLEQARTYFEQTQGEIQADKSAVNVAQADVAQAQARTNLADKLYVRDQALYAHGLLSRQDLEVAQAQDQQAATALAAAQSTLRETVSRQVNAQKRGQVARRALERQTMVSNSGLLSAVQTGPARATYLAAQQQAQAAAAQVRLLGGSLNAPPGLMDITAPLSGIISGRGVTMGAMVTPGQPLLSVLDLRTVVVELTVYQEDLSHVRRGQPVVVTSDAAPGVTFGGVVTVIGATMNQTTRTAQVFCLIRNPQGALRPGVYVTGTIYGAARTEGVAVPSDAVQRFQHQNVVFTSTGKRGVFTATPVQTGETVDGMTHITSGLHPGQQFVSKNAFVLKSQLTLQTSD